MCPKTLRQLGWEVEQRDEKCPTSRAQLQARRKKERPCRRPFLTWYTIGIGKDFYRLTRRVLYIPEQRLGRAGTSRFNGLISAGALDMQRVACSGATFMTHADIPQSQGVDRLPHLSSVTPTSRDCTRQRRD
jgi:hypothetical protein